MEDEDEDEQEDVLALTAGTADSAPAVPAPEIETEDKLKNGAEKMAQVPTESECSLADAGELGQTQNRMPVPMPDDKPSQMVDQVPGYIIGPKPDQALNDMPSQMVDQVPDDMPRQMLDQTPDQMLDWTSERTLNWTLSVEPLQKRSQDDVPEAAKSVSAVDSGARRMAAELWRDGLAVPVTRYDGTAALRVPGAGDVPLVETARPAAAAPELAGVMETMTAAERGLEKLYHWTAQASRPSTQILPMEQAGRTLRAEEPGRTAALTVDELDRAVRRDSRRYDGGMSIF